MNLKGILGNDIEVQTERSPASKTSWEQRIAACDEAAEAPGAHCRWLEADDVPGARFCAVPKRISSHRVPLPCLWSH